MLVKYKKIMKTCELFELFIQHVQNFLMENAFLTIYHTMARYTVLHA